MSKTILITGATDGIGLETAKMLASAGHKLLLHGRSDEKLAATKALIAAVDSAQAPDTYRADLSRLADVAALAREVTTRHSAVDVLINNAGVFKLAGPTSVNGYDVRFLVNTIAPYLLTKELLPLMPNSGRIVNLSSAAQASVDLDALRGQQSLSDSDAYAQSKLGITMWTFHLSQQALAKGKVLVAVNPASFLGSKMVKEAYGSEGKDLSIGADVLTRAALSAEFANASGKYFDNDSGQFSTPHPDALDIGKNEKLVSALNDIIDAQVPSAL